MRTVGLGPSLCSVTVPPGPWPLFCVQGLSWEAGKQPGGLCAQKAGVEIIAVSQHRALLVPRPGWQRWGCQA